MEQSEETLSSALLDTQVKAHALFRSVRCLRRFALLNKDLVNVVAVAMTGFNAFPGWANSGFGPGAFGETRRPGLGREPNFSQE